MYRRENRGEVRGLLSCLPLLHSLSDSPAVGLARDCNARDVCPSHSAVCISLAWIGAVFSHHEADASARDRHEGERGAENTHEACVSSNMFSLLQSATTTNPEQMTEVIRPVPMKYPESPNLRR